MPGPLDGVKMVELAWYLNGPSVGYMLGDLGASIIKIEDPVEGDRARGIGAMSGIVMHLPGGQVVQFECANRNKRSITLDLQKDKAKEILYKLVKDADVFYTNFSQRILKKLGADYETIKKHNPKIIYAWNTSYGSKGPLGDRRGFDIVAQALSGMMYNVGDRDNPEPQMITGAVIDELGATMLAYGVLGALYAREKIGEGQMVESSLLAGAMHVQAVSVDAAIWRGKPMPRHGRAWTRNPMWNLYRCKDDKWLLMSEAQCTRFWSDFCKLLDAEHLIDDEKFNDDKARAQNYQELNQIMAELFAKKTRDEWINAFESYAFAYAPVLDMAEALDHPQSVENEYVIDFDHPGMGKTRAIGFPVKFHGTPAQIQCPAPQHGQHTEEILLEMGYDWEDIIPLRDEGVL